MVEKCRKIGTRGFGLATVLLVGLFLAVLLTVLVGANLSTLSVVRHSEGTVVARSAAQSAIARAIYELKNNPEYGTNGEAITFRPCQNDQELAEIVFDPKVAKSEGVPYSVNNLANAESVPDGLGGVVPARTVRLYAVGRCFDEKRTVVLDLHIPPYPYAVATEGTFESMGDLSLTGLSADTGSTIPGHIATNGSDAVSLKLGPRTTISGDVVSAGGIVLAEEEVEVSGEVRPHSAPKSIPKIDLTQFDPRSMTEGGATTNLDSSFYRNPNLQGKVLRDGDLMMSGKITLDGALLYVEGDLEISGSISGRGAIVATGSVTINGTQALTTDNELAILSGHDLSILGDGVDKSRIEGLIYSEGDVEVRNSTIQGTLISQSNGGTTPRVVMEKVSLVYDTEATKFVTTIKENEPEVPSEISRLAFDCTGLYLGVEEEQPGAVPELPATAKSTDSALAMEATTSAALKTVPGITEPVLSAQAAATVGVATNSDGSFNVYTSAGVEVGNHMSTQEAWSAIGAQVLNQLPDLVKNAGKEDFLAAWQSSSRTVLDDLTQWSLAEAAEAKAAEKSGGTEVSGPQLEIDPMRFLKYGDEMRVRAVQVLETKLQQNS